MHPNTTPPRGANWFRSKMLGRSSGPHRAGSWMGSCLTTLCLISALSAYYPSVARGQNRNSYEPYFRPAGTEKAKMTPPSRGYIGHTKADSETNLIEIRGSSRRSKRPTAAGHRPIALPITPGRAGISVRSTSALMGTVSAAARSDAQQMVTSPKTSTSNGGSASLSVDDVRKTLSKLSDSIYVTERSQAGAASPGVRQLPPGTSKQSGNNRRGAVHPTQGELDHAVAATSHADTAQIGRFVGVQSPHDSAAASNDQAAASSKTLPSSRTLSSSTTLSSSKTLSSSTTLSSSKTKTLSTSIPMSPYFQAIKRAVPERHPSTPNPATTKNAASVATLSSPAPPQVRDQSSRRTLELSRFVSVGSNPKLTGQASTSALHGRSHVDAPRTSPAKSSIIFQRSGRGRLGRPRSFMPRSPKPKPQARAIPRALAHNLPRVADQDASPVKPMIERTSARRTSRTRSQEPPASEVSNEASSSNTTVTTPLSHFVTANSSSLLERRLPAETDPHPALSSLTAAIHVPAAIQPPETADSPSDFLPLLPPADGEQPALPNAETPSPATPDPESAAEEVALPDDDGSLRPIQDLGTDITPPGDNFPDNLAAAYFPAEEDSDTMGVRRRDVETFVFWDAPGVAHRPLYFEEVNLERQGYKVPLIQPVLSGAHFFSRVPMLPYLMAAEKHRQQRYTLGHYRPGSQAAYEWYLPRPSVGGGVLQAVTVTGLLFAFP